MSDKPILQPARPVQYIPFEDVDASRLQATEHMPIAGHIAFSADRVQISAG